MNDGPVYDNRRLLWPYYRRPGRYNAPALYRYRDGYGHYDRGRPRKKTSRP